MSTYLAGAANAFTGSPEACVGLESRRGTGSDRGEELSPALHCTALPWHIQETWEAAHCPPPNGCPTARESRHTVLAATNKYLAQSNKSRDAGKATKEMALHNRSAGLE
jgi:hypothetical protein